jgi:exopolysaccharide biosynthesis polyprenyl glycosylphosphotransferase
LNFGETKLGCSEPSEGPEWRTMGKSEAGLAHVGRAIATLAPILVGTATMSEWGWPHRLFTTTAVWLVWFVCVNFGLAANHVTLASLGKPVAAARGAILGLLATAVLAAWIPVLRIGLLQAIGMTIGVLALVAAWESIVEARLTRPIRLLVVGPYAACANLIRELTERRDRRFQLIGVIDDEASDEDRPLVVGTTADLPTAIESLHPDLVALAPGANRPATFTQLLDLSDLGFRVLEMAHFYEYAFGRVPVRDLTGAWFMSVLHLYQRPYSRLLKRCTDVTGALVLLIVTAPLFALLALLVRITPGPILVRQIRVGEHGRLFTMFKFRTMRADAERPGEAVWARAHDPRITAAGRLMRRLRLDELPQVWNVLNGEMSLVGPRPERPEFVELLGSVPFWTRRHLVKPGITGWAQVKHGYAADAEGSLEKLSYDLWYIRHRSLTVDLAICAQTVAAVVRGEHRQEPSAAPAEQPLALMQGTLEAENV